MNTSLLQPRKRINTPAQVLFASLIGTTIEFFDFYIYATAAVLTLIGIALMRETRGDVWVREVSCPAEEVADSA